MARDRPRWGTKELRHFMPLAGERLEQPRFDGTYRERSGSIEVRFVPDGTASLAGETGTWSVERHLLRVACPGWDCEGALGVGTLFLLASPASDPRARVEWELRFVAD